MDRRRLLKIFGFGAIGSALPLSLLKAKPVAERSLLDIPPAEVRNWKIDANFMTDKVFEMVKLKAGEAPRFPLDFVFNDSARPPAYTIPNHRRLPERFVSSDYVLIPTYDVGYSSDAIKEVKLGIERKINIDAITVLFYAGVYTNPTVLKAKSLAWLEKLAEKEIGSKVQSFKFGPYVILIGGKKDNFVMPIRESISIFSNYKKLIDQGEPAYYGWADIGLGVLNGRYVRIGQIV